MNLGAQETAAAMKRKGWTHRNGEINVRRAAGELECDPSDLGKLLKGKRGPGRLLAEQLRVKLGVPVEHWPARKSHKRAPRGKAA